MKNTEAENRTYGLYCKEDSHPVTCCLIALRLHVCSSPYSVGDCTIGVSPHVEEGCPAEELYKAYSPEGRRSLLKKSKHRWCLALFLVRVDSMELSILLRRHLLHLESCEEDAENQDGGTDVE